MRRDLDEDINWGSLFLKVIIIFVIILLVIWLFSKFVLKSGQNKNKVSDFDNNLEKMSEVATKYFDDDSKLPKEGESTTLTLKEMKELGLIDTLKDGKTICSNKSSYAKVTNKEGKYTLKVLLTCGSNSDYISKVIKKSDNKKDDNIVKEENGEDKKDVNNSGNNSSTNNSTSNNNTNNSSVNYNNNSNSGNSNNTSNYQATETIVRNYEDEVVKYCKIGYSNYNTIVYLEKSSLKVGNKYTYSIVLSDLSNISNITKEEDKYFTTVNDYKDYMSNNSNYEIINGNNAKDVVKNIKNVYDLSKASLKVNNFEYSLSDVYTKDGKYMIDVTITVKSLVSNSYSYSNKAVVFVPIYLRLSYAKLDNCVNDKVLNRIKYSDYYVVR